MISLRLVSQLSLGFFMSGILTSALAAQLPADPKLEQFLVKEFGLRADDPTPTRYRYKRIDLNGDKKPEMIVLVEGSMVCGTGGCPGYVLQPQASGYKIITAFTLLRTPISMSQQQTKGWNDLIVTVGGGGIQGGKMTLRFNGKSYPANPTLAPASPYRPQKWELTPVFMENSPSATIKLK